MARYRDGTMIVGRPAENGLGVASSTTDLMSRRVTSTQTFRSGDRTTTRKSPVVSSTYPESNSQAMGNIHTRTNRSWLDRLCIDLIPSIMATSVMLSLIFGGCCSNVFALEAIIKPNPASGTLLTFVQFLFVAVTGYISQFDITRPPLFLKPNQVPIRRWLINIALFFSINVLNNHAFSYNISVPVHIILRSGGSITTIIAGYLWGKRFSRVQIASVFLLTIGVCLAAYADSKTKAKSSTTTDSAASFSTGLLILLLAQVLSAIMGLYTEATYKTYGPHWEENLFYSHILSIPLFLPFYSSLSTQFKRLHNSPPTSIPLPVEHLLSIISPSLPNLITAIPSQITYLVANVLTQYACISGVNRLAAGASALTVTIVLNVRKLVSLLASIWIFGHVLSSGTLVGAMIVFGAGMLYGLDGGKKKGSGTGGEVKKKKEL